MNRIEVKNKLRRVIREMLLSDLDDEFEIPQKIVQEILGKFGCTNSEMSNENEEISRFVKSLQKWIEGANILQDETCMKKTEETDCDLTSVFEKYLEAEAEYYEVTAELVKVLEEVIKHKEKYSQYFKNKCRAQEINIEVLNEKCQFLKLNFFYKLYGEGNALNGHLALRAKLSKELESLKKNLSEVMEYNKRMTQIKNDKAFCELFKLYQELRRIEERAVIIGQI